MFRAKVSLAVAVVVVALTGAVYSSLTSGLNESVRRDVEAQLGRAQKLFLQGARLESIDFTNVASAFAREDEFAKAISLPDMTARRQALFVAVEARNARLATVSRKADIIAVTDMDGKVLVRDLNPNVMYGDDLKKRYPSVGIALAGTPNKDVWNFETRAMRVAAAPLHGPDGRVAGAMLVGFVMTDKEARAKKSDFGVEVAYALENRVVASSFVAEGEGENAKEDVERAKELSASVFQPGSPVGSALGADKVSPVFPVRVRGEDFLGIAAPLPGNSVNKTGSVILLKSLTQAVKPVAQAGTLVLAFGALALLVALGASVLTARRFLGPLDQLETGVAEVINGNLEYMFAKPSSDFEGMANALNVMLARLLGRPEPSEEDDGDQQAAAARRWRNDAMFVEDIPGDNTATESVDPGTLQLAQEPLDQYYRRTFDEFLEAKRKLGEKVDGVSLESFRAKLSQNETVLKGKYKCKMVRFRVMVSGTQVTLKPIPIY
jgi:hypothetical protein